MVTQMKMMVLLGTEVTMKAMYRQKIQIIFLETLPNHFTLKHLSRIGKAPLTPQTGLLVATTF
jgi:hypothetical protein